MVIKPEADKMRKRLRSEQSLKLSRDMFCLGWEETHIMNGFCDAIKAVVGQLGNVKFLVPSSGYRQLHHTGGSKGYFGPLKGEFKVYLTQPNGRVHRMAAVEVDEQGANKLLKTACTQR